MIQARFFTELEKHANLWIKKFHCPEIASIQLAHAPDWNRYAVALWLHNPHASPFCVDSAVTDILFNGTVPNDANSVKVTVEKINKEQMDRLPTFHRNIYSNSSSDIQNL